MRDGDGGGVLESQCSLSSDDQIIPFQSADSDNRYGFFRDLLLGSHFSVQFGESMFEGRSSELLERVDLTGSVSVSEVNSEVLCGCGVSLGDSLCLDDFSLGGFELVERSVELPEL